MSKATITPSDISRTVIAHPWRFALPVVISTLVAIGYAAVRTPTWEATQALIMRDEAGDRLTRPGKFMQTDEMKISQETILELLKSRNVLSKALAEVGPPATLADTTGWPTHEQIEALQGKVKITPPKGAEFGKTEVFYLKVQDQDPQRAVALAHAVCSQLQARSAQLREAKAQSTSQELAKTVSVAKADLQEATRELSKMEAEIGADLAELRILNDSPSGDSDLRRTHIELDKELRAYREARAEDEQLIQILEAAQSEPTKLLACPTALLKAQPALARLKDGLVDAQLRTGQALGTMSEEHPQAKGARAGEEAIRRQLHNEITVTLAGVRANLRVNEDHIRSLAQQSESISARLTKLAAVRAEYANLAAAAKHRGETLKTVEADLADAQGSLAASRAASLINLVDGPAAPTRPIEPGRTIIAASGFGAGLLIALAFLFLSVQPTTVVPTEATTGALSFPTYRVANPETLTIKQALARTSGNAI